MPNLHQPPSSLRASTRRNKHLKKSHDISKKDTTPPQPPKNPIPNSGCNLTCHKEMREQRNERQTEGTKNSPRGQMNSPLK